MSGVIGARKDSVEGALASYAKSRNGSFGLAVGYLDQPDTLVVDEHEQKVSVLYPSNFYDWDEASKHLSEKLKTSVFAFHIHDGDLWMFTFFHNGEQVAQFNPLPEYWDDSISSEERQFWSGDADAVAARLPSIGVSSIRPYLRHWDLEEDDPGKAFPDDQFAFNDCWQLCDFLRRLGLKYPLNEKGDPVGQTYEFFVPSP